MVKRKPGLQILGHPVHPMLSAFPIPLLGMSVFWDGVAYFRGESLWWSIGFWNICLGLSFSALTALSGLMDYAGIEEKDPASKTATNHMITMFSAISIYSISLIVRGGSLPLVGWKLWGVLSLDGIGLACLTLGGWFGGELVFKFGLGQAGDPTERQK